MPPVLSMAFSKTLLATVIVILSFGLVSAQAADDVVKVNVSLVTVNVSVIDTSGRPLYGLQARDFVVSDEGQPVDLKFFDVNGPASVVLVVDLSSSMRGERWQSLLAGM